MKATLIVILSALALLPAAAAAQRPPSTGEAMSVHPEARTAIDRIKSPYCPGMMLEVCTSEGGAMLRDSIQRMAGRGLSADSIVEVIIGQYGEQWRALPQRAGSGLWAWLLPPLVLVGGLGAVGVVLARRKQGVRDTSRSEATLAALQPEDEDRLRSALRELEEEEEPVF